MLYYRYRILSMLLLVGLLISAVQPAMAQEEEYRGGLRFDAPAYAVDGPYAVGVRYYTIPAETETDRELTASVWYPALTPDAEPAEFVYEPMYEPGQIPPFTVIGHAIPDAEMDVSGAPYPLVVYTHAHWSMGQELPYLIEHLVSRGFVVISTDHEDNWGTDFGPLAFEALVRRPQEVTRQINFAEGLSETGGELESMIATEKVGIGGWSMGGVTAIAAAGARMDLENLRQWCEIDPSHRQIADWACVDILEHEQEMADFSGLDEVPVGLWPSQGDERIAAAVRLSGGMPIFGTEGFATVDIPVMLMHGGFEEAENPALEMGDPYESVSSLKKIQVIFNDAGHFLFFSSCDKSPDVYNLSLEIGFPTFCADDVWDMDRAHDLINHFATAFLSAELKGDEDAAAALAPESIGFPGIEYATTGYGSESEETTLNPILTQSETESAMDAHMPREDAPAFGVRGPYAVGVRDVVIEPDQEGGRAIPTTIWYPALNLEDLPEETTYMLDFDNPGYPDFAVAGRALRDAAPDPSGGPYPLVVYSHGLTLFRQVSSFLAEHLASQGFVVIAGEHEDNWSALFSGESERDTFVTRPQDITAILDFAEVAGAPDGELAGMVDMEQIGVIGHSFGAETALLAGGARLNTAGFLDEWCATEPADMLADCPSIAALVEPMAEMAGLETVPDALWPDWRDERVDAIVAYAPGPQHFGAEGLATVQVPALLFESELDWYASAASEHYKPGELLPGLMTHVLFGEGDHGLYLNDCKTMPALSKMGLGSFCYDPVWDMVRAHDVVNHFTTAFLAAELKGDVDAMAALVPGAVDLKGVEYATTRFNGETGEIALNAELVSEIEAFVTRELEDRMVPGAALGIVKDGELVYAKGFGVKELGSDEPVTPDTNFLVSSVTKTFTGVAIMQLAEQGLIDLDMPVTEYLPYFTLAEPESQKMTIRQLLSHTAGMPDVKDWDTEAQAPDKPTDEGFLEAYLRTYDDASLLYPPGEGWSYSTLGMDVLGDVIAKVSGQSYEQYIEENVLGPLAMNGSTIRLAKVDLNQMVTPYRHGENGPAAMNYISTSQVQAPGNGLFTNVNDLAKFAIANLNQGRIDGGELLSTSTYEEMWTPHTEKTEWADWLGPRFNYYGLGWWVGEDGGYKAIGGYGADNGFCSHMELLPEQGLGVILFVNYMDFDEMVLSASDIGSHLAVMVAAYEVED